MNLVEGGSVDIRATVVSTRASDPLMAHPSETACSIRKTDFYAI